MTPWERLQNAFPWDLSGGSPINPYEPEDKLRCMAMRFVCPSMHILGVGESAGVVVSHLIRCHQLAHAIWITALQGPPLAESIRKRTVLVKGPAIASLHRVAGFHYSPHLVWLENAGSLSDQCALIELSQKFFPMAAIAGDGFEFDWVQAACRAAEDRYDRRLEENGQAWGFARRT